MEYVTKEIVKSLDGDDELLKNLNMILDDSISGHSELQIDRFIISGNTVWGKLHQCKREVTSRIKTLYNLKLDNDLLEIDRDEIIDQLEQYNDKDMLENHQFYDEKRKRVELHKKEMEIYEGDKSYKNTIRELNQFYSICLDLYEQLEDELEDNTPDELEIKYWADKFLNSAKNNVFSRMIGVDSGVIEASRKLDEDMVGKLSVVPGQMKNYIDLVTKNMLE